MGCFHGLLTDHQKFDALQRFQESTGAYPWDYDSREAVLAQCGMFDHDMRVVDYIVGCQVAGNCCLPPALSRELVEVERPEKLSKFKIRLTDKETGEVTWYRDGQVYDSFEDALRISHEVWHLNYPKYHAEPVGPARWPSN